MRSNMIRSLVCLQEFLTAANSEGLIADNKMAEGPQDMKSMWFLREHISVALSRRGIHTSALAQNLSLFAIIRDTSLAC